MANDLEGKVVLVTGGSRGIGAACVKALNRAGADVILHFNSNEPSAREIRERCGASKVHMIKADFSSSAEPTKLWEQAVKWKGSIDVLINNAGIMTSIQLESAQDQWHAEWQRTLQINLIAAADLCRRAIEHFQGRGGGIIINLASRAAFRGDDKDYMHYGASKAGLVAMSRTIARAFAKNNILAYTISPGFVDTELNADFLRKFGKEAILNDIPLKKFASPEEVAHVVTFLASGLVPSATGANIDINGASYVR